VIVTATRPILSRRLEEVSGYDFALTQARQARPGQGRIRGSACLAVDGDDVQVGAPYLENVAVIAKVLDQVQGDKIRVAKFKAKVRYRKVMGFRAKLTKVIIESLSGKPEKKTASKQA